MDANAQTVQLLAKRPTIPCIFVASKSGLQAVAGDRIELTAKSFRTSKLQYSCHQAQSAMKPSRQSQGQRATTLRLKLSLVSSTAAFYV